MREPRRSADVLPMDEKDNESAKDKEKINTGMTETR